MQEMTWPDQDRFPTNRPQFTVHSAIIDWFYTSEQILLITGFASLDKVIELITSTSPDSQQVRILLGSEPFGSSKQRSIQPVAEELRDYWLERGLSIEQCPVVERAVRALREHYVEVRMPPEQSRRVHAKIFCGDSKAMLGSSNFTQPGLHSQIEGNCLFSKSRDAKRFDETWQLAESIWDLGIPCNEWLADLIEQLMRIVPWQEALARACIELLEGQWVDQLLSLRAEGQTLWPSQRDGISQALYVLERTGSVLIADATGSGKTKMGSFLIQAISAKSTAQGNLNHLCGIICPPNVEDNWRFETLRRGPNVSVVSHGLVGRLKGENSGLIQQLLDDADILVLDEAHNYHNLKSNRSQKLLENVALHLMLFTATPINRSAKDLLVLINLLGADNLQDETVNQLEKHLAGRKRITQLDDMLVQRLANDIKAFTVRRTIKQLKAYIASEPEAYHNILGSRCTYPEIRNRVYPLNESDSDRQVAAQVRELASQLKGLVNLQKPIRDDVGASVHGTEALRNYVEFRIKSASLLAGYRVMSAIRSSKYVLIEELRGHTEACHEAGLPPDGIVTGQNPVLNKLRRHCTVMPKPAVDLELLPDFLTDPMKYDEALQREIGLYDEILALTRRLSTRREEAKVALIVEASRQHKKLIAFESRRLAIKYFKHRLSSLQLDHEVHLATGADKKSKAQVCAVMGLPGERGAHIALCSDAMAEGVNLQSASCLIMLDTPSVIRIAEQRVGRIERLDSPHDTATVYWPQDSEEFKLRRDDRFIDRVRTVQRLLGGNLVLPEDYLSYEKENATSDELIKDLTAERRDQEFEVQTQDAFYPVRSLFEGEDTLISKEIIDKMKATTGVVISCVGIVPAQHHAWAFVCQAGTKDYAPRWILVSNEAGQSTTQLEEITKFLRENLGDNVEDLKPTDSAKEQMIHLIDRFKEDQELRLSKRRVAVLKLLERYIDNEANYESKHQRQERIQFYGRVQAQLPWRARGLLDASDTPPNLVTLEALADAFQQLVQPLRIERLKRDGSKRLIRYKDLFDTLRKRRIDYQALHEALEPALDKEAIEPRFAAVIFGIS
ncbi:MAG: hypothetical protein HWE39_10080 [Oceanospirillaceae bacterium]|nr:hypothetical protein [Oceanospirillaceae bacterium]